MHVFRYDKSSCRPRNTPTIFPTLVVFVLPTWRTQQRSGVVRWRPGSFGTTDAGRRVTAAAAAVVHINNTSSRQNVSYRPKCTSHYQSDRLIDGRNPARWSTVRPARATRSLIRPYRAPPCTEHNVFRNLFDDVRIAQSSSRACVVPTVCAAGDENLTSLAADPTDRTIEIVFMSIESRVRRTFWNAIIRSYTYVYLYIYIIITSYYSKHNVVLYDRIAGRLLRSSIYALKSDGTVGQTTFRSTLSSTCFAAGTRVSELCLVFNTKTAVSYALNVKYASSRFAVQEFDTQLFNAVESHQKLIVI